MEQQAQQSAATPRDASQSAWIGEGMLLLAITALAYLSVFAYEVGFCRHFAIPLTLIRPELSTFFVFAASIGTVITLCASWIPLVDLFMRSVGHRSPFFARVAAPVIVPSAMGLLIALCTFDWTFAAGLVLGNALIFGLPALPTRGAKTYDEKLRRSFDRGLRPGDPPGVLERISVAIGFNFGVVWIVGFIVLASSHALGKAEARRQRDFLVVSEPSPAIVLRAYGAQMICATFDAGQKKVAKKFFLLNIGDVPTRVYELQRVGPFPPTP
jgi:hypothetical protein